VSFQVLLLHTMAHQYRVKLGDEANMASESPVIRVCL